MSFRINENYLQLKKNYLFAEVGKRTASYIQTHPDKKVIRMGIGDVTLPLAKPVVDAMLQATTEMGAKETFRGYGPDYGYDFLKDAILHHYSRLGVTVDREDVFVSDGAKSDLGNLTDILGDNPVLIPDPVYPVYVDSNIMAGRKITVLPSGKYNNFLAMPEGIKEDSYVIYLCSPNNPTGAAYSYEQLKAWVDFALKTGSLIIYDSAYEAFVSSPDLPRSIYRIEGAEKVAVEVCSLSKTAGFTGTRCGFTVVPAELKSDGVRLRDLWARRQSTKFNGQFYAIQKGAAMALSDEGYAACLENIAYYKRNAALISELLTEKGIYHTGGINSPYVFFECPGKMGSWEFFDLLLDRVQVVGTPGEGFGESGKGFFRLTGFGSLENTQEAVERLKTVL